MKLFLTIFLILIHITIFSKTDIEKEFLSEYFNKKSNRIDVVEKYLKLKISKDIIFKLVVRTQEKRLDPISRKLISLVLDSFAIDKNSLVKELDRHGRNAYFYMKAYGHEALVKEKYKQYGISPLSYDSDGGTFYSRFLDSIDAHGNVMPFEKLGGTFDTVVNKNGLTAFQYLKNKETMLTVYNVLIQNSSNYEVYLGRLIEVSNDKKAIGNIAILTKEILEGSFSSSLDSPLGDYLLRTARQILAKNDLGLIKLDNKEINILSKTLSLEKTVRSSHHYVKNEKSDEKIQPSRPFETFLTNAIGTLSVSSAKFVGDNYISKRILCLDKNFNIVNLIKAHEVNIKEREGGLDDTLLDHHFFGISYHGIVGVAECNYLIDLDRNKYFKYPFDEVYTTSISIKAPALYDEYTADLLQDTVAANLSLRNAKYVIKRSRKENKIYLENTKTKKIVTIDKYHRCYDPKAKVDTMDCSSPYIDLYGDFNNDGKIDFMYSQGLEKASGTTIFISNPKNDKYTEIELPYEGC